MGGRLQVNANGNYFYHLENSVVNHLAEGQLEKETFTIHSVDGTTHQVEFVIEGTNDAPYVRHGATTLSASIEDTVVTIDPADLLVNAGDYDDGETAKLSVHNLQADHGTITKNTDGTFTFHPDKDYNGAVSFTYDVQDPHGASVTASASMSLAAVADAAVIGGVDTGTVTEASAGADMSPDYAQPGVSTLNRAPLYADGKLTISDADAGEAAFDSKGTGYSYHGQYGDLILQENGAWHYLADAGHLAVSGGSPTTRGTAIDQLGDGQSLTDTITVYAKDGTAHDIVITLHGSNDKPYCSSDVVLQNGTEDTAQTLTTAQLLANTVDVDANDAGKLIIANVRVDHGSIRDNQDGTYTFTPARDYNGDVHFNYDVQDAHGGVTHTGATTSLAAVADAAIITGTGGHLLEENNLFIGYTIKTHGKFDVVDPDGPGESKFPDGLHHFTGNLGGTLQLYGNGNYFYHLENSVVNHLAKGQLEKESFTIHSVDGTTHQVEFVIEGTNDAPYVRHGATTLSASIEDTVVTIDPADLLVNAGDYDDGETAKLSVHNLQADHGTITQNSDGTFTFHPEANYSGAVSFTYDVQDPQGGSVSTSASMNLSPVTDTAAIGVAVTAEQEIVSTGSAGRIVVGDLAASQPLTEMTMEFTVVGRAAGSGTGSQGPVILNMGNSGNNNILSLWNPANMKIGGAGDPATGINLADGNSHRITLTWTSSSGDLKVFDNGHLVTTVHNYHQGDTLPADTYMVLGQKLNNPGTAGNPGWSAVEHYEGQIFNAAIASHALTESQVATAPLATQLDHSSGLIVDVRSVSGQLVDTTGTHTLDQQGGLVHTTQQVDTSLTPPPPGSLLHLDVSVTAPADTDDHVTATILGGLPAGTVVSDGTHSVTFTGTPVDLTGWQLHQITAQLPAHAQNFRVSVEVETTGPDGTVAHSHGDTPVVMDPTQPVPDAQIAGDDTAGTDEDSVVSGILTISDSTSSQAGFTTQADTDGQYGKFSLTADGHWTYTPDARADSLKDGEAVKDSFLVRSLDGTTHTVVVDITGTNDAPVVSSAVTLAAGTEDIDVTLTTAQLLSNASDVDYGERAQLSVHNLHADHGTITDNNDGTFTFHPEANYNGAVNFTYDVQDPHGVSVSTNASMDLSAVADAALISGQDTLTIQEDSSASARGQLTVNDPDAGESQLTLQMHATGSGGYGHFNVLPNGLWTYMVDNTNPNVQQLAEHQSLTDSLVVTSADGTQHTITVNIDGTDDAPVITGTTTGTLMEDSGVNAAGELEASGKLTVTDVDDGQNPTFIAQHAVAGSGGYGSFSIDANGHWTYTADNSNPKIQALKVGESSTDSIDVVTSSGETKTLTMTITGSNDAPTLTAAANHQTAVEDKPLIFSEAAVLGMVGATDVDSDTLHVTSINIDPKYGQFAQRTDGSWIFTPASQVSGSDLPVTIEVSDGHATSSTQGVLDITAVADTPTLQVTVDSLAHPSVNSYTNADFSGTGEAVDFDLTATGYQVPGESQNAGYYTVTSAHGGTADDVFRFTDMQSSQSYHVDGGHGSNVLDLSSYHADDVRIDTGAKTVTVTLADGSTSTINYDNIDQFRFSDQVFDGTPHGITPVKGQWITQGSEIESTGGGPMQTSIVNFNGKLATDYTLAATVNAHHAEAGHQYTNGGIVFDYVDEHNYKVAFLRVGMQSWTIESCENGHVTTVERVHEPALATADVDHHVELHVHGSVAELWSGGVMKASHDFHEPLNDGQFGVVADRAHTSFELEMQPSDWAPSAPNLEILMGASDGLVTTADVLAQAIDPEGHAVSLRNVQTTTAHGGTVVDNGDGTFNYIPAAGFTGQDTFTYEVTDGTNVTTATVRVNIANIHTVTGTHPGDAFSVNIGTDSVDSDETLTTRLFGLPDGSTVTDGTHTATVSSGDHLDVSAWALSSITVTPPAGQTANYEFHVETRSNDGSDTSPWVATPLRVQLQPHNTNYADATIAGDISDTTVDDDTAVFGQLTVSDSDAGEDHFTVQSDVNGQYGKFSVDAQGQWTYTPDDRADAISDGDTQQETFIVTSADGTIHNVLITVTGSYDPNAAPTVSATISNVADLGVISEDTVTSFTEAQLLQMVGASDADGNTLSVSDVNIDPSAGSFTRDASTGDWSFTPTSNFDGNHLPVTIEVSDGKVSTTAHAAIDINPIADTPTLSVALGSVPTTTVTSTSTQVVDEVTFANPYFGDTSGYITGMGMTPNRIAVSGIDPSFIIGAKVNGQDVDILPNYVNTSHGSGIAMEIPVIPTEEFTLIFAPGAPMTGNLFFNINNFHNDNNYVDSDILIGIIQLENPLNREQVVTTTTQIPDIGEDTVIPLVITAGVSDSSETLSLSVSGLPTGSVLSAGTDNHDGTWTLSPSDLSGLQLTPPLDFSGQINLQVTATSTDSTDQISTTTPLQIDISPVAETITLSGSDVTIDEDSGVADLSIGLNIHVDPSETQSLSITGLAPGATLSAGVHNADGSWTLTPAQLQGLSVTPADQWSGTMALRVTATSTETTGEQSQDTLDINVHVNPIVDMTASSHDAYVTPVNAANGIAFPFDISSIDSDETFSFTIDIPQGWQLLYADGTQHISGGIIHSSDDFGTMKLLPPAGYTGSETVSIHVVAQDGTQSHNFDLSSTVTIDPNAPTFAGIDSANVQEDVQVVDEYGGHYLKASGDIDATGPHGHPLIFTPNMVTGDHGGTLTINAHGVWEASIDNSQDTVQNMNTGESFKEVFTVQTATGVNHNIEITVQGSDEANTQSDSTSQESNAEFTFTAEITPSADPNLPDNSLENEETTEFELPTEEATFELGNVASLISGQENPVSPGMDDALKTASTLLEDTQLDSKEVKVIEAVENQEAKEHVKNPDASKVSHSDEQDSIGKEENTHTDYVPDQHNQIPDDQDQNDGSGITG